ncbi:hypothetical protein [Nocardia sp. NPDC050412]|uniref:hypothetical protein n=1 Tax=Nocardia sp. NPDC050412 TaxID=3364320 RepID=UPI0037AF0E64
MTTSATRYQAPGFGASVMLSALHSPFAHVLRNNLCELRYQARRSGRHIALPVSYARAGDNVVVRVARADTKTWWRNFCSPRPLSVWLDGRWYRGMGHVAQPDSLQREEAAAIYQMAFPRAEVPTTDPLVVIELSAAREPMMGAAAVQKQRWGLWRRWFTSVTSGELLGFAAPAVTGALVRDAAPVVAAVALLMAGVVEGSVLGWFQAAVLRSAVPGMRSGDWIRATAFGALVAWSIGAVPVLAGAGLDTWSPWVLVPTAAVGGIVLLLSLGVAQWFVLRHFVVGAGRWIGATALAWLAGLFVFIAFTSPLWQPGQSTALVVLIGIGGGLLMAATMAAVTGYFLVRILRRQPELLAGPVMHAQPGDWLIVEDELSHPDRAAESISEPDAPTQGTR